MTTDIVPTEQPDLPQRDLRDIISLETLSQLKLEEIDTVRLLINFPHKTRRQIAEQIGKTEQTIYNILKRPAVAKALEEAKWAAQTGVETAGDLAAMAEKDIIKEFRKLALDATLDDKVRLAYGKLVLEHRAKLMKALPDKVVGPVEQKGKPLSFLEGEKQDTMMDRMNSIIDKESE